MPGLSGYVWHSNRHTFCSWLAMAGASIKEIQEAAGHKSIIMPARYSHLSPAHRLSVVGGSRLLPNSRSEELTFPEYWMMCRGTRAGVKALRPRSGALQRGLDSGPASAMLCLSGKCHSMFDGPRPKTATRQPLTWLLCDTNSSVEANSHQNSHQIKMATHCRWPIYLQSVDFIGARRGT